MSVSESVRTARLTAERLRLEHLPDMVRMNSDPRVMATLAGVRSEEETRQWHQKNLDHWEQHGFGLWLWRDGSDGRFAGRAGLRRTEVEEKDEVELAYALMPEYWGKGLATEIAQACLQVGFEQLGLADIVAFTLTTNRASERVMQKAGFTYERAIERAGLPHLLYRLSRWRLSRPGVG
jgi:RimJ/RimL family protein N-acetyltransferase